MSLRRSNIGLVRTYRRHLPPMLLPSCRHAPSYSPLHRTDLRGVLCAGGEFMCIQSVLRCHPLSRGGYDPVR